MVRWTKGIGTGRQIVDGADNAVGSGNHTGVVLVRLVDLQNVGRRQEDPGRKVCGIGIGHHQRGERVVLKLGAKVHRGGALQVVEAVTVLEFLHLVLEDEVEGRAEHAAKGHLLLGQATNPEVDRIQAGDGHIVCRVQNAVRTRGAGPGAGAVEEVDAIGRRTRTAEHQERSRRALVRQRDGVGNARMGAVGSDEVDQRFRVLYVLHEISPARVGLELCVAGGPIELPPRSVQGRNAGIATTRQVDGRQIERQAQQVVAQGFGDELVDLVAHLAGHAAHDGTGRLFRSGAAARELERVEEGLDQPDIARGKVRIKPVDLLQQHRVPEAIDGVCELGNDARIDRGVVHLARGEEGIDHRLDGPGELLEHQVLVLHFGAELRRLEQALAVPVQGRGVGRNDSDGRQQPLVQERHIAACRCRQDHRLGVIDQAVVLMVEDGMDGGQADVLVDPAVAGDVVRIQQFVVVEARRRRAANDIVGIGQECRAGLVVHRNGGVRNVVEEGMASARGVGQADGRRRIAFNQHIVGRAGNTVRTQHHHLRETVRTLDEIAVGVGRQQWHVVEIGIGEIDPEQIMGLRLDHLPGGHAADLDVISGAEMPIGAQITIGDQLAGGHRIARGVELIGTQEHLVRRMRAVGLVLVDKRRGGVGVLVDVVGRAQEAIGAGLIGGARQHHEVGRATGHEQRVIRLQWNEHGARTALGDEVQAMVEKLAEEGHPLVEGRGQARVGTHVRVEEGLECRAVGAGSGHHLCTGLEDIVNRAEDAIQARVEGGRDRRRVVGGLVDDQVADGARLRVDHQAAGLGVTRAGVGRTQVRRGQAREYVIGGTVLGMEQVVVRPFDRAQTVGHAYVRQQRHQVLTGRVVFGYLDLVKDERQVRLRVTHTVAGGRGLRIDQRRRWCGGWRRGHYCRSRCREYLLGHAMIVRVNAFDAYSQTGKIRRHRERGRVRPGKSETDATWPEDDVLEDARTRCRFKLPYVTDGVVDRPARVVTIGDACRRHGQRLANGRRGVIHRQCAHRLSVESGHEDHRLIGELQPFDVGETVGFFLADIVGHADDVVAKIERRAVIVDGDCVVRQRAHEVDGIEAAHARQDLTHGDELPRIVSAVQHQRDHRRHAVEAGDLRPGAIQILMHADAHVEPLVAVDEVTAATAFDDVAAIAAEDDIARAELIVGRAPDTVGTETGAADKVPQAADKVEVGEDAAPGRDVGDDGRVLFIAAQEVGEGRARQALHFREAVIDRIGRLPHCAHDIACRIGHRVIRTEEGNDHVDGHAVLVILVGGPVEPGHAVHLVLGIAGDEGVVATFTDHFIESAGADEDVVAGHIVGQCRARVVAGCTVLGAALDPVVAFIAGRRQVDLGAENEIVARAGEGHRDVFGGDDEVFARAAEHQIVAGESRVTGLDDVVAVFAANDVVTADVGDDVVTGAAKEVVVAVAAVKPVVAGVAIDGVVVRVTGNEDVVAGCAAQHDRVAAGVVQVVGIRAHCVGVVADHQRCEMVDPW
ncbi:hypothetical protein D3C85_450760 [compost metagenome]